MTLDSFKYNLNRLKKCNQYWNEMNPIMGGRLCTKCDKTIVDFSNMTFTEIAIFMSESKEPICGFYLPEQLQQTKHLTKTKIPLAISLSTLIATTSIANPFISYQQTNQATLITQTEFPIIQNTQQKEQNKEMDTIYFSGRVQYFDIINNVNSTLPYFNTFDHGLSLQYHHELACSYKSNDQKVT